MCGRSPSPQSLAMETEGGVLSLIALLIAITICFHCKPYVNQIR